MKHGDACGVVVLESNPVQIDGCIVKQDVQVLLLGWVGKPARCAAGLGSPIDTRMLQLHDGHFRNVLWWPRDPCLSGVTL